MPLVTQTDLENAQVDLTDLGLIVGGSATLTNPGFPTGTVTTRLGEVVKTLAKVAADGGTTIVGLLTPKVYNTTAQRDAALGGVSLGQLAYDRETTQIYMAVDEDGTGVLPREWVIVSELSSAEAALIEELYAKESVTGRTTVNDVVFLKDYDDILAQNAIQEKFIKWPGGSTTLEGLALALNYSAWPAVMGAQGTDFGLVSAEGDLIAYTSHPDYEVANNRIKLESDSNPITSGYLVNTSGYIDQTASVNFPIYIYDSKVDCDFNRLAAIAQNSANYPIYIRRCELTEFQSESVNLRKGHIVQCYLYNSKGDGVKLDGDGIVFDGNFIRLVGQIDIVAHGDGIQMQGTNDVKITRNTIYIPGTGTTYDEVSYGTTNCVRTVTENAAYSITEVLVAGNLLIGGGYSTQISSRFSGSLIENVVYANNVFGNSDYYIYGPITSDHHVGTQPGTLRNLILYNNIRLDGSPITYAASDQNGLWRYDKQYASRQFLEIGKRLGLLDWNGDVASGVTNRTV